MAALAAQVFSPNTKTHQAGLDGFWLHLRLIFKPPGQQILRETAAENYFSLVSL
jgi:hypothetical protein